MWKRLVHRLLCPIDRAPLELIVLMSNPVALSDDHLARARALGVLDQDFTVSVTTSLLLCHRCRLRFPHSPRSAGAPAYTTVAHEQFARQWAGSLTSRADDYAWPSREPVSGERLVMSSFSTEWLDYDFDGVICLQRPATPAEPAHPALHYRRALHAARDR